MQIIVDLSRLRGNIRRIRAATRNRFCAVVKAQAYGHGYEIARYIEPVADSFFVSSFDEAAELVFAGIKKRIIVLGGDIPPAREVMPNVTPTVCDVVELDRAVKSGYNDFAVAVNTGMNRLGADHKRFLRIKSACSYMNILPSSVYSHVYGGLNSAAEQASIFERITADRRFCRIRHLYSSCALELPRADLYDMTRCGIAMYGYANGMLPCLKARARIVAINRIGRGEHVGYGDFTLASDTIVATVDCGYADGLRRTEKPQYLKVRGSKCAVLGAPCMDRTMIDVTNVPCRIGEYAYFIEDKEDAMYIADSYETIIYEVLTGLNGRAKRIYV